MADRLAGFALEKLYYKQTRGDDATTIYAVAKTVDDVLILGSSRATHHYVSSIIEDSLQLKTYNIGREEMNFLYSKTLFSFLSKRYYPKIVIIDIQPGELYANLYSENVARVLRPLVTKYPVEIGTILNTADPFSSIKNTCSKIYPFNGYIGSSIQNTYTHFGHAQIKGFKPKAGNFYPLNNENIPTVNFNARHFNDTSIATLMSFVKMLSNMPTIEVYFVVSPYFYANQQTENAQMEIKKIVTIAPNIHFINFSQHPLFVESSKYFRDITHLNQDGAKVFTSLLVNAIHSNK